MDVGAPDTLRAQDERVVSYRGRLLRVSVELISALVGAKVVSLARVF